MELKKQDVVYIPFTAHKINDDVNRTGTITAGLRELRQVYVLTEDELEKSHVEFIEWTSEKKYEKGKGRQFNFWFDESGEGIGTTEELFKQFLFSQ